MSGLPLAKRSISHYRRIQLLLASGNCKTTKISKPSFKKPPIGWDCHRLCNESGGAAVLSSAAMIGVTGKNHDHRRQWLDEQLVLKEKFLGIDLLCQAPLPDHSSSGTARRGCRMFR